MRIAFDLDGVLADLDLALSAIAGELFPQAGTDSRREEAPPGADDLTPDEERLEPPQVRALSRQQQHAIWDAVHRTTDFWETLAETEPGIVARIAAVAEEHAWEVIFLTQRPGSAGSSTQRQSQRWLASHGFDMPSVFVLGPTASRGKVAAALDLDAVVDDRTENCLDVKADSSARAFLVARDPGVDTARNAARLGIEVVSSVAECVHLLERASRTRPGLLGRLRKLVSGH